MDTKDTATWAGLYTHNQIHKGGLPSPGPTRPSVLSTSFLSLVANGPLTCRPEHSGPPQTVPAGKLALTSVIATLFLDSHSLVCLHHINTSWDP